MLSKLRPRSAYDVMAALSLFIVLGGTSYAVATGSIDSREIKNSTIRSKDIRNNEVSTSDVRNGSLLSRDFKAGQLPAGATGPQGPQGPQGLRGVQGSPGSPGISGLELVSAGTPFDSTSDKMVTATCPAGKRTIGGTASLGSPPTTGAHPSRRVLAVPFSVEPSTANTVPGTVTARATELVDTNTSWRLNAHAFCAHALTD